MLKKSELYLLYANPIKILLFESVYSSALYCWTPKTASIKLTHKSALSFGFSLEETWPKSKNWKGKYGLGVAACTVEELWAPDQTWVNKLPILAGINSGQEVPLSVCGGDGLSKSHPECSERTWYTCFTQPQYWEFILNCCWRINDHSIRGDKNSDYILSGQRTDL